MADLDAQKMATIDPEFAELVKTLPARAPAGSVSIEAIRAYFVDRKSNLNASGLLPSTDSLVIKNDSVLSRDGYAIPIRTYRPKNPPARGSPLVVFVHGGGFCVGNLDTEELNCQLFAAELGCVCVNPDYRLAPENLFPAAVLDCWDVLKWAAANATALGASPTTAGFVLGGTSAGGNIGAALSVHARDMSLSPPLTGVALLIPALTHHDPPPPQFASQMTSMAQNAQAPIMAAAQVDWYEKVYAGDPSSPLFNVLGCAVLEKLPPTFVQVCGLDPLRDDALVYVQELKKNGVETNLKVYDGVSHGFWGVFPKWEKSRRFVRDTVDGMKWLLQNKDGRLEASKV